MKCDFIFQIAIQLGALPNCFEAQPGSENKLASCTG